MTVTSEAEAVIAKVAITSSDHGGRMIEASVYNDLWLVNVCVCACLLCVCVCQSDSLCNMLPLTKLL